MNKRPTRNKRLSSGGAYRRPIRLVFEPLEARRLLAGLDLSGGQSSTTLLTLDFHSTAAQQATPSALNKSSLQDLQAEGEAAENSFELLENAPWGTLLGPVVFDDPLSGQQYTLHSADPRFSIAGNDLYFSEGELDFESEPMIGFLITAVNDAAEVVASTGAMVIIGDVNEQPLAIELSGGQVMERDPGAYIGDLFVVDPDADAQTAYAFYLFDSRFTLSGSQLRLADGVELDYAAEPEVLLAVAATDGTHEIFDTVRIEVVQQSETPVAASSIALDPRQVVELTGGALVGQATVIDAKDNSYEFSVSDERFEFVGNQLKLRNDRQVDAILEPEISLTLTAIGDAGDEAMGTFSVTVIGARSPYHNYNTNEDVNGDGFVSPIDALLIINELNTRGAGPISTVDGGAGEGPTPMLDVNGDGLITPIDVLLIINHLNSTRSTRFGSLPAESLHNSLPEASESTDPAPLATADSLEAIVEDVSSVAAGSLDSAPTTGTSNFFTLSDSSSERRKRENATIDAELELLLDQLSQSSL